MKQVFYPKPKSFHIKYPCYSLICKHRITHSMLGHINMSITKNVILNTKCYLKFVVQGSQRKPLDERCVCHSQLFCPSTKYVFIFHLSASIWVWKADWKIVLSLGWLLLLDLPVWEGSFWTTYFGQIFFKDLCILD